MRPPPCSAVRVCRGRVTGVAVAVALAGSAIVVSAQSAPRLAGAQIRVAYAANGGCDVSMKVALEPPAPREVDHRLRVDPGARVEDVRAGAPGGALAALEPAGAGRVASVRVPTGSADGYELRYRVLPDPGGRTGRCPVWVPTVPAPSGRQNVRIEVLLPEGVDAGPDTFPGLRWDGRTATAALNHVPAFVDVSLVEAGTPGSPWRRLGLHRAVDAAALSVLALATLWWTLRRRAR